MRGEGPELPTSSICNLRSTRLMRRNVAIKSPAEASARPRGRGDRAAGADGGCGRRHGRARLQGEVRRLIGDAAVFLS
jgi:hypothetical protein